MCLKKFKAFVIGTSAGGFYALHQVLPKISLNMGVAVVVVLHRRDGDDDYLAVSLSKCCSLHVKEAEDKEVMEKGIIYIAPPGYHLLIEKDMTLSLSVDAPVRFARPSIDVLFESAAEALSSKLIGVILTGANSDGSSGIEKIKKMGGVTIAQNPDTAYAVTMPVSAIATGAVDFILSLDEIPAMLGYLTGITDNG